MNFILRYTDDENAKHVSNPEDILKSAKDF